MAARWRPSVPDPDEARLQVVDCAVEEERSGPVGELSYIQLVKQPQVMLALLQVLLFGHAPSVPSPQHGVCQGEEFTLEL